MVLIKGDKKITLTHETQIKAFKTNGWKEVSDNYKNMSTEIKTITLDKERDGL